MSLSRIDTKLIRFLGFRRSVKAFNGGFTRRRFVRDAQRFIRFADIDVWIGSPLMLAMIAWAKAGGAVAAQERLQR
jgi:hypothetical protein